MPVDHFPSTHATWIDAQLTIAERSRAAGDAVGEINAIDALRRHLMERYHAALRAYVCGGSLRRLGEPDEHLADLEERGARFQREPRQDRPGEQDQDVDLQRDTDDLEDERRHV